MDYFEAVTRVLEEAARSKSLDGTQDIVAVARQQFGERGSCDASLINPIEKVMLACLAQWSELEKRQIWETTDTGQVSRAADREYPDEASIDLQLESELLYEVIEELARRPDEA